MEQGEVAEDEFWEGLQSLGLGRNLSRSHVSRIVKSFKASGNETVVRVALSRGLCATMIFVLSSRVGESGNTIVSPLGKARPTAVAFVSENRNCENAPNPQKAVAEHAGFVETIWPSTLV